MGLEGQMDKMTARQIGRSLSTEMAINYASRIADKPPEALTRDDFGLASHKAHLGGNEGMARVLNSLEHFTDMVETIRQDPSDPPS
jgi:hypothetical protein